MFKRSREELEMCDRDYPGVLEYAEGLEAAEFPNCPLCDSEDTAKVNVGVIGRTILLCTMTTRFHLIPNGPKVGAFFCNSCRTYFDALG